jgi:signal transduction histidine kinase
VALRAGRARISVRQLGLFVLSMVVPSVVLVGLGIRIIVQQEELAEKSSADQQRLRTNEFERALAMQLDRVRADPRDPAVALVATIVDGRLILPWDVPSRGESDAPSSAHIARAEREEFTTGRLPVALSELDAALDVATSETQRAHARLIRARVYAKAQRPVEAARDYRTLLGMPLSITDEDGMPFALYAADRLLTSGRATSVDRTAIAGLASFALGASRDLPPAAWYLLRRVDAAAAQPGDVSAATRREKFAQRLAEIEHALALQRDIPTFITQWKTAEGAWLPHGAPLWLVGASSAAAAGGRIVVAVRAEPFVNAHGAVLLPESGTSSGDIALVSASATGEWLGDRFPGVKVRMPPIESSLSSRTLQRGFYGAGLVIVLSVTLFGAYLLWRDVNREMRIATLRSQFVSSVSHELKTPLTAIRMFAETLQLDRVDAATRREYLDTIVNESERLTRLLNNVLDFSKIEEGRKAYRRETASLAGVVRTAARAMTYPLEQHGFVLRVEIDDSLPPLNVDADALEQAILNLLTNAMKYSGAGRTIDLQLARDGRHAVISVRDEGIGIPPADQARIFEKFYRISTPENQRIPGTGLGLTLVDHIIKAHDGSVHVESAPGSGSIFSIRLPLHENAAPAVAVEVAS